MMAHQRAPEHETADAGADDQREPEERVADGGAVSALEQFAIFCLGTGEAYQAASARPFSMASAVSLPDEAVVVESDGIHGEMAGVNGGGIGS